MMVVVVGTKFHHFLKKLFKKLTFKLKLWYILRICPYTYSFFFLSIDYRVHSRAEFFMKVHLTFAHPKDLTRYFVKDHFVYYIWVMLILILAESGLISDIVQKMVFSFQSVTFCKKKKIVWNLIVQKCKYEFVSCLALL